MKSTKKRVAKPLGKKKRGGDGPTRVDPSSFYVALYDMLSERTQPYQFLKTLAEKIQKTPNMPPLPPIGELDNDKVRFINDMRLFMAYIIEAWDMVMTNNDLKSPIIFTQADLLVYHPKWFREAIKIPAAQKEAIVQLKTTARALIASWVRVPHSVVSTYEIIIFGRVLKHFFKHDLILIPETYHDLIPNDMAYVFYVRTVPDGRLEFSSKPFFTPTGNASSTASTTTSATADMGTTTNVASTTRANAATAPINLSSNNRVIPPPKQQTLQQAVTAPPARPMATPKSSLWDDESSTMDKLSNDMKNFFRVSSCPPKAPPTPASAAPY